jgi:hypothetical protein
MGDEDEFGSDGKDYMNTSRDKIQRWTALPGDLDGESRVLISEIGHQTIRRTTIHLSEIP